MTLIQQKSINTIRVLSAEMIEKANSGHPGLPMGAAAMAYELWTSHMVHNPKNPTFFNRDRFVLSAGHGSALLYSLLHLFGYDVTIDDLKKFRQFGSRTPGHPEVGHTAGVETSTGPLGQGVANAVGMAQAETILAAKFNKAGLPLVDHYTYCLCGDGCMMEGIESEAASLAGTWGLGKLILLYDSNNISIEGHTDLAFTENVALRHKAQGWQVLEVEDGNDPNAIGAAINFAKTDKDRPSLIVIKTVIGYGADKAGTADVHGAPLGADGINAAKKTLGYTAAAFSVPKDVAEHYAEFAEMGEDYESEWKKIAASYKRQFPDEFDEFTTWTSGNLPELADNTKLWEFADKPDATRNTSGIVLNKLAEILPNLIGGSADLAPSNKSDLKGKGSYSKSNPLGRNIHFGVREHAMAAISNGIYLHGGLINYCATFFVFSDYMKNAMRMSALMNIPVTYVLTHDSIGVGEDGPTHQPVEQLIALRSIPNFKVFRPADGKETTAAYISALTGRKPTAIVLTRQNLPQYADSGKEALKGGYILVESKKRKPDMILMASGSEVELVVKAKEELLKSGIDARVVSMPSIEVFEEQPDYYKENVLPSSLRARVAVEAGSSYSWYKYVGLDGKVIGMDTFGASAPADKLFKEYGFTVENVVKVAKDVMAKN